MALVLVTKEYEEKVNGKGPKRSIDNYYLELYHIVREMTPTKMLGIVMESEMRDDRKWKGVLGINIVGRIYVDMTGDLDDPDCYFSERMVELEKNMRCILGGEQDKEKVYSFVKTSFRIFTFFSKISPFEPLVYFILFIDNPLFEPLVY